MTRVLCFGDSNTYGYVPEGYSPEVSGRFDENTRYTGILGRLLGNDYLISEDGLCGRTTVFDKDDLPGRKGADSISESVRRHKPDILVIMLGTNDCKTQFEADEKMIAEGIVTVAKRALSVKSGVAIILVSPIRIESEALTCSGAYNQSSLTVSKKLAAAFALEAVANGFYYADVAAAAKADPVDGEHLTPAGHFAVAELLASKITSIPSETSTTYPAQGG